MIKIQTIKQIGDKYILITDKGKYTINEDVLLQFGLLKPQEIDEKTFIQIKESSTFYDLYEKAIKYLTFKMRSKKEVQNKLIALGCDNDICEKVIAKLKSDGYIDDDKYLKLYIKDRINLSLDGPKVIKEKLVKLGFPIIKIDKELNLVSDAVWEEKITKIINKRLKVLKNKDISEKALKQKLSLELAKEGFAIELFLDKINAINIDDSQSQKKAKEKIRLKLSKKYSGKELELRVKQKLYALGYKDL